MKTTRHVLLNSTLIAMMALAGLALAGCGNKDKKAGQALASVNGEEITVMQLNSELRHANVTAAQQEAASKQLLEGLIDRQLVLNEAAKEKLDRDPGVVQDIERAKAMIVAQAYMQRKVGAPTRPTKAEIDDYFTKHPEFFSRRKQFDMKELVLASRDIDAAAKAAIDASKTLDDAAAYFSAHKIAFTPTQISRTSSDLPPELAAKLLELPKGQLFIIKEGDRSLLISIAEIKDAPVTAEVAAPQIEQFLMNKKGKEAADAEMARLRAAAKVVRFNQAAPAADKAGASAPAASAAAAVPAAGGAAPVASAPAEAASAGANAANDRGVAGLK